MKNTQATCDPHANPLGLIAGEGELPFLVARGARDAGRRLAIVGLRGCADPRLAEYADWFGYRGVARMGSWIAALRRHGCREAIMAGRVRKATMFAGPRWVQWLQYLPDLTSIRVWYFGARDKRNDSLLRAVANELERRGLPLIDSTTYCRGALAQPGVLSTTQPSAAVRADVEFAWPLLRQIAELDIGQALAVKEREIIAVEAIEGTDAMIKRAGQLCRAGGWTLIKMAKRDQDMRFDVPTIGPHTIENLANARGVAIAIEAHRTLILERERTLETARQRGVTILARQ